MSCVMWHMSHVTCDMSYVIIFFFFLLLNLEKVVKLVGGGSVIIGVTPPSLDHYRLLQMITDYDYCQLQLTLITISYR